MRAFSKAASAVFVGCVLLLSGCSALRPLPNKAHHGRHTLGVDSVNWLSNCAGMSNIGFSTSYKALEVPHGVIMGQVQIHNRGFEPFEFRTPGFRLTGSGGYMDSAMKCPDNQIPAGGVMQCGFAAPALDAVKFDSFQPFFVPRTSASPCFCKQPYSIEPFFDPIFEESPAKSFADAVGEAFGGPAFHQTLDKLESWKGNPLALAEDIVDSIFSTIINTPFQFSAQLGDSSLEIFTGPPARRTPPSSADGAQNKPAEPAPTKADASITPAKPAEPAPTKADAPITPAKPAEPVPTKADAPTTQTKPDEPVPTKADAPITPTKPAEPVPTKADAPITPAKPAEPAPTKADAPITPDKPAEPVPTKADAPITPAKPAEPAPTKADTPITPAKPAEPAPTKADTPNAQTKPAEPAPTKVDSAAGKTPSEQQAAAAPVADKPATALPSTPAPEAKAPAAVKPDTASSAAPKQVPTAPKTAASAGKPAAGPQKSL